MFSCTRIGRMLAAVATGLVLGGNAAAETAPIKSILFIGNSFTYGAYSPVRYYRNTTVTDLNHEHIGGVPALFKSFADESGLRYEVSLETHGGVGLDWHLANKSALLASRPYDQIVMHGFSTLNGAKPGDPALLVDSTKQMAHLLKTANPAAQIYLTATWARPDLVYPQGKPWHGKGLEAMAADVRSGYDLAAKASGEVSAVIPVGEAFDLAVSRGIAGANPYEGLAGGQVDLWTYDHYHASYYGYYLEALMVFARVTGRDPRSLGDNECTAYELGISPDLTRALQQVAFDELSANGGIDSNPQKLRDPGGPSRCQDPR